MSTRRRFGAAVLGLAVLVLSAEHAQADPITFGTFTQTGSAKLFQYTDPGSPTGTATLITTATPGPGRPLGSVPGTLLRFPCPVCRRT
jgi:hypothetical protein